MRKDLHAETDRACRNNLAPLRTVYTAPVKCYEFRPWGSAANLVASSPQQVLASCSVLGLSRELDGTQLSIADGRGRRRFPGRRLLTSMTNRFDVAACGGRRETIYYREIRQNSFFSPPAGATVANPPARATLLFGCRPGGRAVVGPVGRATGSYHTTANAAIHQAEHDERSILTESTDSFLYVGAAQNAER